MDVARCDALVIGGGPGGLTGALYLARFRRRVLVVDDGASRAARIPRSRNYPGFVDGVPGAELVAAMRAQAARHGACFAQGRIESLQLTPEGFVARWPGGTARAPLVLLATGASDVEPAMPHLAQALREGALRYCPVCDGYEAIGRRVGLVADAAGDWHEALYLRHFSDAVTLFPVSAEVRFTPEQRQRLAGAGVALQAPVEALRLAEGGGVTVRAGGRDIHCDALYCALGLKVHSQLAVALGALHDDDGSIVVDAQHRTSIEGLWAVGDVAKGLNQIAVATGGAAVAASAMHLALHRAEVGEATP